MEMHPGVLWTFDNLWQLSDSERSEILPLVQKVQIALDDLKKLSDTNHGSSILTEFFARCDALSHKQGTGDHVGNFLFLVKILEERLSWYLSYQL